ncbi:SGNH/GDSL hydrolase family protein [Pedobacter glucosidilyticus]|uniref:SGNH/GDSL hydrolase family protein n=1 Tax=Pedobacter glucosidilyticus TaxID=1122941 RepID=UPI00040368D7|nr:SGNH/GDSL hydrolase family protein [Pedobacter glucosidilyticus]
MDKKIKKYSSLVILLMCFTFISATFQTRKNILIIGDSISIGYTPFIQKKFIGINIEHNPGNGGSTFKGVQNIEKWLGEREWDVVMFNFGLHDMVYKDTLNRYDLKNGKIAVSLEDYRKNLQIIVNKLKETTAHIVFITTTTVPENAAGRMVESPLLYNNIAKEVMNRNEIDILDLYETSLRVHPLNSYPNNVHYTEKGSELLAQPIISKLKSIINEL